ncbi:MAG: ABC transporter permease [Gammaproteobacteria bacterium]
MNLSLPTISPRAIAVWRRNVLVWRKLSIPALLGNFGEPLLYLLALGYGLGSFVGNIQGVSYVAFLASGIVCSSAMNTATFEGLYSAYTRMTLQQTWAGMLVAPLNVDDVVLGEIIWAGTKSLISGAPILVIAALLGLVHGWSALWVLPVVLLAGISFGAMALVITSLAKSYDFFLYYFTLIITPMLLFSGVFFPVDRMPGIVRAIAQLLPLTHAVQIVRPLMNGQPVDNLVVHLAVLLIYAAVAFYLATVLVRRRLMV